jgi:hypothetical protein
MLSAIVCCEDRDAGETGVSLAEVLARTLASLVTAKVEGLLCDVRIAGPAGMSLGIVANHAGCGLIEGAIEAEWLRLALEASRGPYILVLRRGEAPEAGFIEEAIDFLDKAAKEKSRTALLRAVPESFLERLFPSLAPPAGVIATRDLMLRAPRASFQKLARQIAPATTFHTRMRTIG